MNVFALRKENKIAWLVMPEICDRIRKFSQNLHTDIDAEMLVRAVETNFVIDEPMLLVLVGMEGNKVVGYCLSTIDEVYGDRYLTIMHYEKNPGYKLDQSVIKDWFNRMLAWGRSKGAIGVQLVTPDEKRAKYFERMFGFERHRILMRRSIVKEVT